MRVEEPNPLTPSLKRKGSPDSYAIVEVSLCSPLRVGEAGECAQRRGPGPGRDEVLHRLVAPGVGQVAANYGTYLYHYGIIPLLSLTNSSVYIVAVEEH